MNKKQLPLNLNLKGGGGGDGMYKAVMQRNMGGRTLVELAQARAGGGGRVEGGGDNEDLMKPSSFADEPAAVWDPERDEMPSPFLARGRKVVCNVR